MDGPLCLRLYRLPRLPHADRERALWHGSELRKDAGADEFGVGLLVLRGGARRGDVSFCQRDLGISRELGPDREPEVPENRGRWVCNLRNPPFRRGRKLDPSSGAVKHDKGE